MNDGLDVAAIEVDDVAGWVVVAWIDNAENGPEMWARLLSFSPLTSVEMMVNSHP